MRHFVRVASRTAQSRASWGGPLLQASRRQSRCQSAWTQKRHVRLRNPWLDWRRLGLWTFYGASSYGIFQYLQTQIVDRLELGDEDATHAPQEEDEDHDEDDDGQDEEETVVLSLDDEDGSFVAVQAPKQLPRQKYKQSDPEWQEFVKLSRDSERQTAVRQELSDKLVQTASALKPLRQKLGKDISWTKSWLDFTYPDQAAPEYVRQGWVLLEDGALWSKQIMPHSQYVQMQHILWPKALLQATRQCLKAFYALQAVKVKNALGMELNATEKQLQLASKVLLMQASAMSKLENAKAQIDQIKANVEKDPRVPQQMQKQNPGKASSPNDDDASHTEGVARKLPHLQINLSAAKPTVEFALVMRVFAGALAQAWKQSKLDTMPPGCCFLSGDVELTGSQARCKMGVLAAYDPKASSFVWVSSKPKGFWSHSQVAKGGS